MGEYHIVYHGPGEYYDSSLVDPYGNVVVNFHDHSLHPVVLDLLNTQRRFIVGLVKREAYTFLDEGCTPESIVKSMLQLYGVKLKYKYGLFFEESEDE